MPDSPDYESIHRVALQRALVAADPSLLHLHFALHRNGEYVDPLAVTTAEAPVPEDARARFERVQRAVTQKLAALPERAGPLTVSLGETASATATE